MAVFYADSAGSQGTGDGSSAANACTLKEAIENAANLHTPLVAGSIIWCKNGTKITYDGSSGVFTTPAVAGTEDASISVMGYGSSIGDGGIVEIEDSNAGATNYCINSVQPFWYFAHFKIINPRRGFNLSSAVQGCYFFDIEISGSVQDAIAHANSTNMPIIYDKLYIHDCSYIGISDTSRCPRVNNCRFKNNGGSDIYIPTATYSANILKCVSDRNNNATAAFAAGEGALIDQCTINRATGAGINILSGSNIYVNNTIITNCGGYGIAAAAASTVISKKNCFYSNTSGEYGSNITVIEEGKISSDPLYTDETNGVLTLQSSSPCINTGLGYNG